MRKVSSTRKDRDRQLFTNKRVWYGNKYHVHRKMTVRRPHEKTSVLKMRFLDTVIAPAMRMSDKKTMVRSLIHFGGSTSRLRKKI